MAIFHKYYSNVFLRASSRRPWIYVSFIPEKIWDLSSYCPMKRFYDFWGLQTNICFITGEKGCGLSLNISTFGQVTTIGSLKMEKRIQLSKKKEAKIPPKNQGHLLFHMIKGFDFYCFKFEIRNKNLRTNPIQNQIQKSNRAEVRIWKLERCNNLWHRQLQQLSSWRMLSLLSEK